MMRQGAAIAHGGRFFLNWQRTTPALPWGRQTLPQIERNFVPLISFLAL